MGKAKMFKIRSIDDFENVYQSPHFTNPKLRNYKGEEVDLKGKWNSEVFKNNNPIVLELACGKGDYAIALAKKYPNKNFIGIDSKGARIFTGSKIGLDEKLSNLVFVRLKIENITNFFEKGEIDETWITFSDPFPKERDAKRRLTDSKFLERYRQISKDGALVHFKTDDLPLYQFSVQSVADFGLKTTYKRENIYDAPLDFEELDIKTYYEKSHLSKGRTINYLQFEV